MVKDIEELFEDGKVRSVTFTNLRPNYLPQVVELLDRIKKSKENDYRSKPKYTEKK